MWLIPALVHSSGPQGCISFYYYYMILGAGGSHISSMVVHKISHFQGTNEEILSHFLFLIILYHKNFFKSTFCRNMPFFRIFDDFQRFLAIFAPFLANFDQFLAILSHFCSFLRILGGDLSPWAAILSKIFKNFSEFHPSSGLYWCYKPVYFQRQAAN